jgi:hypothetical protein
VCRHPTALDARPESIEPQKPEDTEEKKEVKKEGKKKCQLSVLKIILNRISATKKNKTTDLH